MACKSHQCETRRAYKEDVAEFFGFAGLKGSAEVRTVTRAHVIAWRKDLERRGLADTSIRRKLSALSSLFDYLCERNAVLGNPVDGVKRPSANGNEGSTPALGDAQARKLLDAPTEDTLKGKRDSSARSRLGLPQHCAALRTGHWPQRRSPGIMRALPARHADQRPRSPGRYRQGEEWLGHSNVSTTRLYDRRKTRPEDSPTFHVKY